MADGATITLLDVNNRQHKMRLSGIDAPEVGQPFGRASKQHLAERLAHRQVVAGCSKIDRYGREVCMVVVDGVNVSLKQIEVGMAWYFRRHANELPRDRRRMCADMETQARAERRGLWADAEPVALWDWRRKKLQASP